MKKTEMTELHRELIDEVMDCFEFEKVAKTMEALNWHWAYSEDPDSTPELHEIKKAARQHLKEAVMYGFSSSGGFHASFKDGVLDLKFVVESWDAFDRGGEGADTRHS